VGHEDVDLRFAAPCAGCSGCAGHCRAFRLYEPVDQPLTLPLHLFPQDVGVGHRVELHVADAALRRLAGRMYAGTLAGLIGGAALAATLASLVAVPVDLAVLVGAVTGCYAGWRVSRPDADLSLIDIQASS
jgi:hypothetical protein